MSGVQRCSWVGHHMGLDPSQGSHTSLDLGWEAPCRGWSNICLSTGSPRLQFQSPLHSHTWSLMLPWYVSWERDCRCGSVTSGAPQHHSDVSFRCRGHKGLLGVQGRGAQTAPLGGRPAWLWKNLFGKDNLPHTEADWRHVCQTMTRFFK